MTGDVRITPVVPPGPGVSLELVGDATLEGGSGGWEDLPRPLRVAATEWTGTPAKVMTLPLLLDGTEDGGERSVEYDIALVTTWGLATDATDEPPILVVGGPLPDTRGRWVAQEISWGPCLRARSGVRIQQDLTVVLRQHVAAAVVTSPGKRAAAKKKAKKKSKGKGGKKK